MNPPVVHVLSFEGCPHAESARAAARAAISQYDPRVELVEIDLLDPTISVAFKGYPSPTVLVGMRDVSPGEASAGGIGCRASGAPSVEDVLLALQSVWGRDP